MYGLQGDVFMQQKMDKDVLIENWWLLAGPLLFILMGILVIILTYYEKPVEYASLQTKTVTVEKFSRHYGAHGSSYDYIRTSDGEKYTVSGEYQPEQLEVLLTNGTGITIKWYQKKLFGTLLAEEIYVHGIQVVAYDNDAPVNKSVTLIVGACSILLGLGCFCFLRFVLAAIGRKPKNAKRSKEKRRKAKKRKATAKAVAFVSHSSKISAMSAFLRTLSMPFSQDARVVYPSDTAMIWPLRARSRNRYCPALS